MDSEAKHSQIANPNFFRGGGQMGKRIRSFDWENSPLGPPQHWQNSLKTAVRIILDSRYPMFLWWGHEFVNLYNDAYIPILGKRHPDALGRPAPEIWSELWGTLGLQANAVLQSGESSWNEQALLIMERHGYREETYFTFSYSPVPDDAGRIGGVFCACTEDTHRVLGERRLRTLRQLGALTGAAASGEEACRVAAAALAERPHDVPFALFYLLGDSGEEARLVASVRLEPGTAQAPEVVSLSSGTDTVWPLAHALTDTHHVLRHQEWRELPGGPWTEPVKTAAVLPLIESGRGKPTGFLVVGASPLLAFDDDYQGFFDLLAASVASSIAKARALEDARKQAQALAEIDRAKTVFFSNVAHELRTPLTLILGPIEDAMAQGDRIAQDVRSGLDVAHRNGLRLLRLINGMLDFSRIEAGRMDAFYERTDLASLTRDLASVFRSAIEKAKLSLIIECPPLPQPVYVDKDMWEKIVLNLISNAFKYTLKGSIRVRLCAVGDSAELTVEDTGVGIPEGELPHIFERFYRVSGAVGRTQEGSGIGLALIEELVKLHSGSISVTSRIGEGSAFRVVIPFGSEHLASPHVSPNRPQASTAITADAFLQEALRWLPSEAGADASPPALQTSGPLADVRERRDGRIILADDNADMREYVRHILGPQFDVEAVSDGQQALEAVQRQVPELVLTDIMMPRLDGIGLLKQLRSNPATVSIPVVLLTARADEESLVEGMKSGADDYLMKPFSARELVARVAGHLATARARREAAETLRQSQEQLAQRVYDFDVLLRELPVGIAVSMDPECRNIRVNPAFAKMLGIDDRQNASKSSATEAELPFRVLQDGVELRPDQLPMQVAARESREVRDFEADIVRKDGTVIRELSHAVPLLDEGGAVRGSLAVFVDITERRQAEEALRESEERFRNMAENAPVMIWVTDPSGYCVYINRQWREFTGTTLEQNLDLGWLESVHPVERPTVKQAFTNANVLHEPFRVDYQVRRKDGQWRWVVDSATPRFGEDGSFLGYIGSVIDITERKEMESALRASEEKLALAQTAAGVGSWDYDTETGLSSFSGEYYALHGLPKDHPWVSFEEWLSRVHEDDRERVREAMRRAYWESHSLDIEFRVVYPDGTTRWLAGKGTVFCDEAGKPKRFTGINYDITERKLAEDELLKTNDDLKQFAFAASHDLQEPLRVVVNYTQLLERRYKDQLDEGAAKIIDTAVGSALRMERLLKGLRDYWHVSDRQSIQIASVDLGDALQKALLNLEDAVQESQATVIHEPLPVVSASETPMVQVFQNLLGNSMKYRSPERPLKIEISCESRPSEYVISIADNGIGIDPKYANQVFGIFKRLHGQEYAGAGIGLSICQKIIERLGGKIWLASREQGSVFRFSIPMRLGRTSW